MRAPPPARPARMPTRPACTLLGIGTALPPESATQAEAAELVGRLGPPPGDAGAAGRRRIAALYRATGVRRRHSVLLEPGVAGAGPDRLPFYPPGARGPTTAARMEQYSRHAPPLAARAAAAALEDAGVEPRRVTQSVTASCTGFAAPGVDLELIDRLKLPRGTGRTHVGFMGCHAALNALRVAGAYCAADPAAVVLVTAVELCSLHHQYTPDPLADAGAVIANGLFADGAAAAVCVGADHPASNSSSAPPFRLSASGSAVLPGSAAAMTWRVGDAGFAMTLAPAVPDLIREHLAGWSAEWLARRGLKTDDVKTWAVHPGGPAILDAAAEALDLPPDALDPSRALLAFSGNLSSPTILFLLDGLRTAPRPCVALGFGPGLTIEAALLT